MLDNVLRVSGESGEFDPQEQFEHGGGEIERLARMGSEIVRIVAERDAARDAASVSLQYHVKLAPGDVAPYVLLPGDPGRVPVVASYWDEAARSRATAST